MTAYPPVLLPERDAAEAAAAKLEVARGSWFRRSSTLAAYTPSEVLALSAVYLAGRGVRRDSWSRTGEVSERELERLSQVEGVAARLVERSFQIVDDPKTAIAAQCTHCGVRPGFGPCTRCIGTGRLLRRVGDDESWVDCGCDQGFVRCTQCGGTQRVFAVTIRFITDTVLKVEEWAVPNAANAALAALRALGTPQTTAGFSCELESTPLESAYRGASTMKTPSFFGFELLDAAERARDRLARVQTSLSAVQAESFAVPFFLLRYAIGKRLVQAAVRRLGDGSYAARLV